MSWLEFFPFPSHSALLYFFSRCSFSSAASCCCTTLAAQQQQKKVIYSLDVVRQRQREASTSSHRIDMWTTTDRWWWWFLLRLTYQVCTGQQRVSGGKFRLSRYAELAGFFTFFSLLACTAAVCSSSWPLLIILSTSHKLGEYKLTFIHFYFFVWCAMQPLTHTPGAVPEFSHADNIIDIWKEAIDVLSFAVFSKTIRQSRCTIKPE